MALGIHPVPPRCPPSFCLTDGFTLDGEVCQAVSCGSLLFLHIVNSNLILICNKVANVKLISLIDIGNVIKPEVHEKSFVEHHLSAKVGILLCPALFKISLPENKVFNVYSFWF